MDDLKGWVSGYRRVAAICGRAAAIWLDPVVGIFAAGWLVWQEVQGFTPSYLVAALYFFGVPFRYRSLGRPEDISRDSPGQSSDSKGSPNEIVDSGPARPVNLRSIQGCDSCREPCFLSIFVVFGPPRMGSLKTSRLPGALSLLQDRGCTLPQLGAGDNRPIRSNTPSNNLSDNWTGTRILISLTCTLQRPLTALHDKVVRQDGQAWARPVQRVLPLLDPLLGCVHCRISPLLRGQPSCS